MGDLEVLKNSQKTAETSLNGNGPAGPPAADRPSGTAVVDARHRFDRFVLDTERGCLLTGEEEIALRPKTFELLRYLLVSRGRLVSKDELLTALWPDVVVTEDSLFQCVADLRRALQDERQQLIRTVQRRGYRFDGRLLPEPSSATADLPVRPNTSERRNPFRRNIMPAAVASVAILAVLTVLSLWWLNAEQRSIAPLSLAVIPFQNLSDDVQQEFLAAGLTVDLTTDLSRIPDAFVIAPATAYAFKGTAADPRQIGRELNVHYLVEGIVHRYEGAVHINVQLIDAATGSLLWTDRLQRTPDEIGTWQDEIVGRIASALNLRLTRLEGGRTLRERRSDPDAYALSAQGWALLYTAKKQANYASARALFDEALTRDPDAVNAMAGIAWSAGISLMNGWSDNPNEDRAAAEKAVARLLAIDPNHVIAHHVRGFLLRIQKHTAAADDAFRTVVSLNPNFAPGHAQLGLTEVELGRPEEAIRSIERAMRLSPRDPNFDHWCAFMGMAEFHRANLQQAIAWLSRAIQSETSTPTALQYAYFVGALALAGRTAEAQRALAEFLDAKPGMTISKLRAGLRSNEREFVAQEERLYEGLHRAGLPE